MLVLFETFTYDFTSAEYNIQYLNMCNCCAVSSVIVYALWSSSRLWFRDLFPVLPKLLDICHNIDFL